MQKLAKREEQIMQAVWNLEKAFIKDIIQELPDPKPHYNSVATMLKILKEKGFLEYESVGNMFQYYPAVSKEDYQKHSMKDIVSQYFDNSYSNMLAFFAKEQKLTEDELNDIINIIKSNKK
ncbi:BlaI/MecI/CopY family transcriptional regulator [Mucilaginibacter sp. BJC16-A38]|jgi:BlaI family penicillinase repressor|uniref:BlaI/MecI/CopY family transcriptional regulator n=1 Tax=Mucilaginibacter phenanthrenivorans TaxID=1234842 RepID=UPI002158426A|nr:BlaI/MecI/CopY family transcriptional regulator [Mucilaginibacter phenanthrenivorans]MCR8556172.1 BlaI/MecI/CopY family transcriptional regulator [Mucilaginibacter phenanthrenivorans]MDP9079329.1 BlaI/MecI/CopY family transcriptional regulator [Bacteroidota bacterium]